VDQGIRGQLTKEGNKHWNKPVDIGEGMHLQYSNIRTYHFQSTLVVSFAW